MSAKSPSFQGRRSHVPEARQAPAATLCPSILRRIDARVSAGLTEAEALKAYIPVLLNAVSAQMRRPARQRGRRAVCSSGSLGSRNVWRASPRQRARDRRQLIPRRCPRASASAALRLAIYSGVVVGRTPYRKRRDQAADHPRALSRRRGRERDRLHQGSDTVTRDRKGRRRERPHLAPGVPRCRRPLFEFGFTTTSSTHLPVPPGKPVLSVYTT